MLEDKRGADPVREIQRKDLKELITKGLSRAERLIIILYYFEEMTMKEIGATLDLSESRVSQMHSSILARLKAQMADKRNADMAAKGRAAARPVNMVAMATNQNTGGGAAHNNLQPYIVVRFWQRMA